MIRPRAVRRAEAHACPPAIGFPAAGEDLAFVEIARRRAVRVEREVHGLGVGLPRLAGEIDGPRAFERGATIGGNAGRGRGARTGGEQESERGEGVCTADHGRDTRGVARWMLGRLEVRKVRALLPKLGRRHSGRAERDPDPRGLDETVALERLGSGSGLRPPRNDGVSR